MNVQGILKGYVDFASSTALIDNESAERAKRAIDHEFADLPDLITYDRAKQILCADDEFFNKLIAKDTFTRYKFGHRTVRLDRFEVEEFIANSRIEKVSHE